MKVAIVMSLSLLFYYVYYYITHVQKLRSDPFFLSTTNFSSKSQYCEKQEGEKYIFMQEIKEYIYLVAIKLIPIFFFNGIQINKELLLVKDKENQ